SGVEAGGSAHPQSSAAIRTDRVAQASVSGAEPGKLPVSIKSSGFVVKANGELDAILAEDDDVQIVRQGDSFDGRYRAVSVSAETVEAVEETPWHPVPFPTAAPPEFPDLLSASLGQAPSILSDGDCL